MINILQYLIELQKCELILQNKDFKVKVLVVEVRFRSIDCKCDETEVVVHFCTCTSTISKLYEQKKNIIFERKKHII